MCRLPVQCHPDAAGVYQCRTGPLTAWLATAKGVLCFLASAAAFTAWAFTAPETAQRFSWGCWFSCISLGSVSVRAYSHPSAVQHFHLAYLVHGRKARQSFGHPNLTRAVLVNACLPWPQLRKPCSTWRRQPGCRFGAEALRSLQGSGFRACLLRHT